MSGDDEVRREKGEKDHFSHLDESGRARMVDVGKKPVTDRFASATARVFMAPRTLELLAERALPKGDVLAVAKVAGIAAAKETPHLVPMCHPLPLDHVQVDIRPAEDASALDIIAEVKVSARTGVEMEALTAAAVAALTIYDMCKAVDDSMEINGIRVLEKRGGRSGEQAAAAD